jgi:hypothetical protein
VLAFARAFSGSVGLLVNAEWEVRQTPSGAAAVYHGRRGLGVLSTILSETSALEADSAVGSEVTFTVEDGGGCTVCHMWLSRWGRVGVAGLLGATSDARFIRPYMQQVERRLRALDPSLQVAKGLFSLGDAELPGMPPAPALVEAPAAARPIPRSAVHAAAELLLLDDHATAVCG